MTEDIAQKIAEAMRKPVIPEERDKVTIKEIRKNVRLGLIDPEIGHSLAKCPESLRRWLGGSDVISSESLHRQLMGQIPVKRLEQIRRCSLPNLKEAQVLSEFFSNYGPENITNYIFRRLLKKMRTELGMATLSPSEAMDAIGDPNRKDMVLCLVSRAVAMKNRYQIFRLVDSRDLPKGRNARRRKQDRGAEESQGADAPSGPAPQAERRR